MTRGPIVAGTVLALLGCSGIAPVPGPPAADAIAEPPPTIPAQTDFASWALPAELARRARAAGWEVERCDRFDDGTWVTTNCDLRRDGSYAFVAVDELNGVDAAEEQVSFAEPIEAVTRDGNLVLSARVFDRQSAAEVRDALAPEGVPLLGVDEAALRERVGASGWTLNWCEGGSEPDLLQLACEVERDGVVGFVDLEQERIPGAYKGEDRLLEGPEAVVDHGHALLAVEVPDGPGAQFLLRALLDADPVEEVAIEPDPPEPAGEPDVPDVPDAVAVVAATPVPTAAPAPVVTGIPVAVSGPAEVVLVDRAARYPLPAAVPRGRYVIEARFPGDAPFNAGKVTVLEGQRPSIVCSATLAICRANQW